MRLRQSLKNLGWRYQWVILKPVFQPQASQQCSEKCDSRAGWCDWCGGKNVGACCKRGDVDDPTCKHFDAPLETGILTNAMPSVCVHTDCIQTNTAYFAEGTELKKFTEFDKTAEECQSSCQDVGGAAAFTSNPKEKSCTCLSATGLTRKIETGSSSGPIVCGKVNDSVEAR